MATSDSEDFESADEGFDAEDSPKRKPEPQKVTSVEQKPDLPAPSHTEQKVEPVQPVADSAWEPEDFDEDILDGIDEPFPSEEPVLEITKKVEEPKIPEEVKTEPKVQVKEEQKEVSAWEPEDLDDDILDLIDEPFPSEEPVLEKTKEVDELKIPVESKQEPKVEVKEEKKVAENIKKIDNVIEKPAEEEVKEEPKDVVPTKERRPRPVREAKGVNKLASGASKKLGNKLATPASKPEPENIASPAEPEPDKPDLDEPKEENVVPDKIHPEEKPAEPEKKPEMANVASVLDKLSSATEDTSQSSGWGSWGGWGTSLLSTATSSVSSLGSHVISTVIDTVESGLGAPDPEEIVKEQLAAALKEPAADIPEEDVAEGTKNEAEGSFPLGSWMSGVSNLGKMVESTGSKVLTGGLDTLENIGKKTMQVLQDGDPGLKKKRSLFEPEKPVLSHALREAKEMADQEEKAVEEKMAARKVHFETLFDDYQGLVHLEALEMLSRQCEMRLQSSLLKLAGAELKSAHERLVAIRDESILPSTDDLEEPEGDIAAAVLETIDSLPVKVSPDKLLKTWTNLQNPPEEANTLTEFHAFCISTLAEMTSACVEIFHRVGELLTVNDSRDPLKEAEVLQKLTINVTFMVEKTATLLCDRLNEKHQDSAQPIITKVFLEASNSSTYIQDAFQLLMPVLQQAALQ